jgi:hypothetical protein
LYPSRIELVFRSISSLRVDYLGSFWSSNLVKKVKDCDKQSIHLLNILSSTPKLIHISIYENWSIWALSTINSFVKPTIHMNKHFILNLSTESLAESTFKPGFPPIVILTYFCSIKN